MLLFMSIFFLIMQSTYPMDLSTIEHDDYNEVIESLLESNRRHTELLATMHTLSPELQLPTGIVSYQYQRDLLSPTVDFNTMHYRSEQYYVPDTQMTDQPNEDNKDTTTNTPYYRADYMQSKKKNKKHPLITDGYLIELCKNGKKLYQCTQCPTTTPKSFTKAQSHINGHHFGFNFNCDICSFSARQKDTVTFHMRNEHLRCCQETFASKAALKQHRSGKIHHNGHLGSGTEAPMSQDTPDDQAEESFLSPELATETSAQSQPTIPMSEQQQNFSHEPEPRLLKDYIKPLRFYTEMGKQHPLFEDGLLVKIDEHENRYQCAPCKRKFKEFNNAQRHSSSIHLKLALKCDMCNVYCTELKMVTDHMREKHLRCCQETFASQAALDIHISMKRRYHNLHAQTHQRDKKYQRLQSPEDEMYKEVLAFFNLPIDSATQISAPSPSTNEISIPQHHASSDNQMEESFLVPELATETSYESDPRLLEDYIKPLRFYTGMGKEHPLIADGYLVKLNAHDEHGHRYQCIQCAKTFLFFSGAQMHSTAVHLKLKFLCDTCDYYSTEQNALTWHIRIQHRTCCQQIFDTQAALTNHCSSKKRNHNLHVKISQ